MNYLAHAFLSFGDTEILAGNMFSDFVKGRKKFDFPAKIQKGIALHRAIDQFTDEHSITAEAKKYFKSEYGLYSAPFIDIVYDHFLATDENIFKDDSLKVFAEETYFKLAQSEEYFPEKFSRVFHYMQLHNWLYNYQFEDGIFRSFTGLVHRAKFMNDPKPAFEIFKNNYQELKKLYEEFFPQLKNFARFTFDV